MSSSSDATTRVVRLPATLSNLADLAAMLEWIEHGARAPDPQQYRHLVAGVTAELERQSDAQALKPLLDCFPATAELYENLRYSCAGLCLSPLERSVQTERIARQAIQAMMTR